MTVPNAPGGFSTATCALNAALRSARATLATAAGTAVSALAVAAGVAAVAVSACSAGGLLGPCAGASGACRAPAFALEDGFGRDGRIRLIARDDLGGDFALEESLDI